MKYKLSSVMIFLMSQYALASENLVLSKTDSAKLLRDTAFRLIKTETVVEDGKEYSIQTRGASSNDKLLEFKCFEKYFSGMKVDSECSITIDTAMEAHQGNAFVKGNGGTRVSIGNAADLSAFTGSFKAYDCPPKIGLQLFASIEKREVELPDGRRIDIPLVSIVCYGDASRRLTQISTTMFARP